MLIVFYAAKDEEPFNIILTISNPHFGQFHRQCLVGCESKIKNFGFSKCLIAQSLGFIYFKFFFLFEIFFKRRLEGAQEGQSFGKLHKGWKFDFQIFVKKLLFLSDFYRRFQKLSRFASSYFCSWVIVKNMIKILKF